GRPPAAAQGPLVGLGGGERQDGGAVRQGHEGDLLALEELLHHDAAPRVAEQPGAHELVHRVQRRGDGRADEDPLSAREAVGLDDDRRAHLPHVAGGVVGIAEHAEERRRHTLRVLGDAGVAGRAVERADARALPELPHERVLAPAAADDEDAHQWRKWRTPVKTMATPCASAARMTSSSRVLPPGCTTAVAPAAIASSSPSAKGKKASLARTEPVSEMPSRAARARAFRTGSTREV